MQSEKQYRQQLKAQRKAKEDALLKVLPKDIKRADLLWCERGYHGCLSSYCLCVNTYHYRLKCRRARIQRGDAPQERWIKSAFLAIKWW